MCKVKRKDLKKEIREKLLERRGRQSKKERVKKSLRIWKKLKALPQFMEAKTVMFYLSLPDEVDTEIMVRESMKMGKRIVVPISKVRRRKLTLSILKNYDRELGIGAFNIPQPKKRYIRKTSSDIIDLVIVPGVAFDQKCGRLGFGKGFYDYFLKNLPAGVSSIALAYDFQVLVSLPLEEYDVLVDKIITEKRVIDGKGG